MNKLPLVSIIMPTYNRAHLIEESLACVLNQTYSHWECIIVDDGSTDDTYQVLKSYLKKDNRISYYKKDNAGVAVARNYAVQKSKGSYILPLDSDDLIGADYITKAIDQFLSDTDLTLVYSKAEKIGVETGEWPIPPFDYNLFLVFNMIFNSSMYKRSDFDAVGGYSEDTMFEDWDLWIKLLKRRCKVYQLPEVFYYYRTHKEDSVTTHLAKDPTEFKESMDALFRHHVDTYLEHIGNPILLERERRALASLVKTADYQAAVGIMKSPLFRLLRKVRGTFKRLFA